MSDENTSAAEPEFPAASHYSGEGSDRSPYTVNSGGVVFPGQSRYTASGTHVSGGVYSENPYYRQEAPVTAGPIVPSANAYGYGQGSGHYGNGGHYGPPYMFPTPTPKPRYRWSSAFVTLAAVLGLLIGGVVGAGITSLALNGGTSDYSSTPNALPQSPSTPESNPFPGDLLPNTGQPEASGLDQGTRVDSAPGLVVINSSLMNGTSAGTGFVIDSDNGLLLTNYHVVADTETVMVTIADTGEEYEAKVLGHDATKDIAVLQIPNVSNLKEVTVSKDPVKVGDSVKMWGNGNGQGFISSLDGTVTATDETIIARDSINASGQKLQNLIETDADVVPGYSGGVMLNSNGDVVGITVAASGGQTTDTVYGYAIPVETGLKVAQQVLSGDASGSVVIGRNAALGIQVLNTEDGSAGAIVAGIIEGSAAEAAGLQKGDKITSVNGESITDAAQLSELIRSFKIGDTVTITIERAGQSSDITVTLKESSFN